MKKIFYPIIVLIAGFMASCKKDHISTVYPTSPSKTGSTLDLIKDSVYLYAKEDYLWFDQLPTYAAFVPRSFNNADDLTALTNELNALSQYAINPTTKLPYELSANQPDVAKYSFIDDGTISSELNGEKGDFGFDVQFIAVNDLRVEYVYPGSPAAKAGIKRGYKITSINNSTSITLTTPGTQTESAANISFISNAIYDSGSITMALKKPDSTIYNVNFSTANYTVNPVLKDTVLTTANNHKVGYIVFNSFTSDDNANPQLDPAFSNFAAQGITDLIVDLRYNGGGYVSTAEHLDNLIVPPSKSGSLMYNTYYNSNLVSNKAPLLTSLFGPGDYSVAGNLVNFAKAGSLNINRVFFIITDQTASASELTINNLRPQMDVEFVGTTSYGKPVGFFAIDINKYQMYTPEFSVLNSAGQGGYYSGFTPAASGYPGLFADDDVTKEFGDPTEGLLAHILNDINTGNYTTQTSVNQNLRSTNRALIQHAHASFLKLNKHQFSGMVFNKKLKSRKIK
jgi:carboxyl-terminal processing protease